MRGDPTVATKEKGETWLDAAVTGLKGIIREFREVGDEGEVGSPQTPIFLLCSS